MEATWGEVTRHIYITHAKSYQWRPSEEVESPFLSRSKEEFPPLGITGGQVGNLDVCICLAVMRYYHFFPFHGNVRRSQLNRNLIKIHSFITSYSQFLGFSREITCITKNQKDPNLKEKRQLIGTNAEMTVVIFNICHRY